MVRTNRCNVCTLNLPERFDVRPRSPAQSDNANIQNAQVIAPVFQCGFLNSWENGVSTRSVPLLLAIAGRDGFKFSCDFRCPMVSVPKLLMSFQGENWSFWD